MSLTAAALEVHRLKLIALRADILADGDLAIEPVRADVVDAGSDEDGQPLVEMQQVIASNRNRTRTAVLARIDKALRRLAEAPDIFGQCSECEEPIGKRLNLLPYVELCLECQQGRDGSPRKGSRRGLTDFS